ncbi:MAG: nuclease-related domain-containing protein [Oscillospiraceae bacterium]
MPYIILGSIIGLIVLFFVFTTLIKRRKIIKLGKEGEAKVAKVLKSFARIRSYKVINDIYLPLYDKTTQVDHILIGFFGILVVETKNLSGEIYADPKKKDWLHIVGKQRNSLYNPLMQNQAHIDCIRYLLGKENLYNINIESIVVLTNKKCTLFCPPKLPIVNIKRFKKFLHDGRFDKDNNFDVDQIYNAIMKHKVTDKKLIANHNSNVKKMAAKK